VNETIILRKCIKTIKMKTNKNQINVIVSYTKKGGMLLSAIHPLKNYLVEREYYYTSKNVAIKNFKNYIQNI